jgi:hypothetical protein
MAASTLVGRLFLCPWKERMMSDEASNEEDPLPASPASGGGGKDGSSLDDPEAFFTAPGNNRPMQKRRKPRRRLFGKRLKEAFLEHFSCTANVAASAAAVGISEGAVYTHRRKDAEFRDAFWMALEQGAAKLVALRVQMELERAQRGQSLADCPSGDGAHGGQSASDCPSALELRLDGPPDVRQVGDLIKLMATLRDLCRGLAGGERPGGRTPTRASVAETCKALAKRLKAFDARVKAGTAAKPPKDPVDVRSSATPQKASADEDEGESQ